MFNHKLSLLSVLTLSALLVACSDPTTTTEKAAPSAPVAATSTSTASASNSSLPVYKVRIANEPYPPFNIFNADLSFSGLETDVLNAIAAEQGFRIEFVPYPWNAIFTDLKQHQHDMVAGGLSAEDISGQEVMVSDSYMRSPDCVVTADANTLKDWTNKRVQVGEEDGLTDMLTNRYKVPKSNIVIVKTKYEALRNIAAKQADAVVSDCNVLKYYMASSLKDIPFAIQELPVDANDKSYDLVIMVRKDDTELLKKINAGIASLKKSGQLDTIVKKWTETKQ